MSCVTCAFLCSHHCDREVDSRLTVKSWQVEIPTGTPESRTTSKGSGASQDSIGTVVLLSRYRQNLSESPSLPLSTPSLSYSFCSYFYLFSIPPQVLMYLDGEEACKKLVTGTRNWDKKQLGAILDHYSLNI